MNPEEAMGQGDAIDLAYEQVRAAPRQGTADLAAGDGLLDQHLRVILPCGLHRTRQFLGSTYLADAEGRTRTGGLHEDGIGEPAAIYLLVGRDGPELRRS